jgi:hypothetical protein
MEVKMGHLACIVHKRRVLITKQPGEQEAPFALHRADGSYCRGTGGFSIKDMKFKGVYEALWRLYDGEDDTVKWPEGMEKIDKPTKKRRRRKTSEEKLLEEIFTKPELSTMRERAEEADLVDTYLETFTEPAWAQSDPRS